MDLDFPLKNYTSFLGPINQKSSMLPVHLLTHSTSAAAAVNCTDFWGTRWSSASLPFLWYLTQFMSNKYCPLLLLYFPSHSCFLLCNVIFILLQCIILHHCIIFVINSSCCFWLCLDTLCRVPGLLCSVQGSTWEIEIQMWQQTSPGLGREDGMAMVLITNS